MTPTTPSTDDAPRPDGVATISDNASLEHTAGGATTRDAMDAGVPMIAGDPREPVGPEDAYGPGAKRGDYSDRTERGPSLATEVIPDDERHAQAEAIVKAAGKDSGLTVAMALGDVPRTRLVDQKARAQGAQADEPGKGGVPGSAVREGLAVPTPSEG